MALCCEDAGYDGDEEHSAKQVVYFTAHNIQYQLFVERTDDGTKMAEEMILSNEKHCQK